MCDGVNCDNGDCDAGVCDCDYGWGGDLCDRDLFENHNVRGSTKVRGVTAADFTEDIIEDKSIEMRTAFIEGVAAAAGVDPSFVTIESVTDTATGVSVTFVIAVPPSTSAATIESALSQTTTVAENVVTSVNAADVGVVLVLADVDVATVGVHNPVCDTDPLVCWDSDNMFRVRDNCTYDSCAPAPTCFQNNTAAVDNAAALGFAITGCDHWVVYWACEEPDYQSMAEAYCPMTCGVSSDNDVLVSSIAAEEYGEDWVTSCADLVDECGDEVVGERVAALCPCTCSHL